MSPANLNGLVFVTPYINRMVRQSEEEVRVLDQATKSLRASDAQVLHGQCSLTRASPALLLLCCCHNSGPAVKGFSLTHCLHCLAFFPFF